MIYSKEKKEIENIIKTLSLDLAGYSILTEVGSNDYIYTPIIALMANADKVFAITKDSSFGKAQDIVNECNRIISSWQLDIDKIKFSANKMNSSFIKQADIITNLGFIRPINADFLKYVKKGAVIATMSEAWELREEDIDIEYCRNHRISVRGTYENHPSIRIFDYCGPLAIKLCFQAGYEVYKNKILIVSKDNFGEIIYNAMKKIGPSKIELISPEELKKFKKFNYDFIFIADYVSRNVLIGGNGILIPERIQNVGIIHLAGVIDYEFAEKNNIFVFPEKNGYSYKMTETFSYLSSKPVIELHAAGLKVGELVLKNRENDLVQKIV